MTIMKNYVLYVIKHITRTRKNGCAFGKKKMLREKQSIGEIIHNFSRGKYCI